MSVFMSALVKALRVLAWTSQEEHPKFQLHSTCSIGFTQLDQIGKVLSYPQRVFHLAVHDL